MTKKDIIRMTDAMGIEELVEKLNDLNCGMDSIRHYPIVRNDSDGQMDTMEVLTECFDYDLKRISEVLTGKGVNLEDEWLFFDSESETLITFSDKGGIWKIFGGKGKFIEYLYNNWD